MKLFLAFLFFLLHSSLLFSQKFQNTFSKYEINIDSCSRIEHASGSLIFIENNAFDTENETVFIHYREMRTPLEMIMNNLQMHVEIAGQKFPLESLGMFEIYALDGEDTLDLVQGKRMEVRMNIDPEIKSYGVEGFQYDHTGNHWTPYTNQVGRIGIMDDDELWGSSSVSNEEISEIEEFSFGGGFSSEDPYVENAFIATGISDFGLFNYDRILEGLDYVSIKPRFSINKATPVSSTIYVVYDNINTVFYFPEDTWEEDFFLIKGQSYKLFTFPEKENVSFLSDFPDLVKDAEVLFNLEESVEIPDNKEELSRIVGIR